MGVRSTLRRGSTSLSCVSRGRKNGLVCHRMKENPKQYMGKKYKTN